MPLDITAFEDPILLSRQDSTPILTKEHVWHQEKPVLLIYASCHGRTVMDYFRTRKDIMAAYNIIRLETGPMYIAMYHNKRDPNLCSRKSITEVFRMADVILTYNMGARHGQFAIEFVSKYFRPDVKVITFVAPNVSCFCPFGYGYTSTMPVLNALDRGQTLNQVWTDFENGQLDCLFPLRWRLEMGRLSDKEGYHDIGLTKFIAANLRKEKLWSAPAHPTFLPMAYVGNEVCVRLGFERQSEDAIMAMPYTTGGMTGQPETDYEFKYYKFEYPKRHANDLGGLEYYRPIIHTIEEFWKGGGFLLPAVD